MSDFEDLRRTLEEHLEQFAQLVEDQVQFRREYENLQRYWQQEDDQELALEETRRVMAKYPPVWQALTAPQTALPRPGSPPQAPPVAKQQQPPPSPTNLQEQPSMEEQRLPASTLERLAMWDKKLAIGKEIVAGCIGFLIVLVTLVVAITTIFSPLGQGTSNAAKEVLVLLNGLVGVVLGYYFGRVPGEARADKAESEANAARSDLDRTVTEIRVILGDQVLETERGAPVGAGLSPAQADRLRKLLRLD